MTAHVKVNVNNNIAYQWVCVCVMSLLPKWAVRASLTVTSTVADVGFPFRYERKSFSEQTPPPALLQVCVCVSFCCPLDVPHHQTKHQCACGYYYVCVRLDWLGAAASPPIRIYFSFTHLLSPVLSSSSSSTSFLSWYSPCTPFLIRMQTHACWTPPSHRHASATKT